MKVRDNYPEVVKCSSLYGITGSMLRNALGSIGTTIGDLSLLAI